MENMENTENTEKQQDGEQWTDPTPGANLERVFQSHQEGEVDGLQDSLLIQCVFNLLQLHHLTRRGRSSERSCTRCSEDRRSPHLLLVKYLHGKVQPRLFVFDQHDPTKRTGSQRLQTLKVVQSCSLLRGRRGRQ